MNYIEEIQKKRDASAIKQQNDAVLDKTLRTTQESGDSVVREMMRQNAKTRQHIRDTTTNVRVEQDIAEKRDIARVVFALRELNKASQDSQKSLASQLVEVITDLKKKSQSHVEETTSEREELIKKLQSIFEKLESVAQKQNRQVVASMENVVSAIQGLEIAPQVNVESPTVNVPTPKAEVNVDLEPLLEAVSTLQDAIKENKIEIPATDFSTLESAISSVKKSIDSLTFPVPNYILPFKDSSGKAVQLEVEGNGIPIAVPSGTPTVTTVPDTTTSTQLAAFNPNRKKIKIYNTSSSALYVLEGTGTASSTNCTVILYKDDFYADDTTVAFQGKWETDAGGFALVTQSY